jgi:hypothetical protein
MDKRERYYKSWDLPGEHSGFYRRKVHRVIQGPVAKLYEVAGEVDENKLFFPCYDLSPIFKEIKNIY